MTFPILASLLVRLVVLLPFQLLRLSLATPSRWTPLLLFVFQAEDGIRVLTVIGVQTCALPILNKSSLPSATSCTPARRPNQDASPLGIPRTTQTSATRGRIATACRNLAQRNRTNDRTSDRKSVV